MKLIDLLTSPWAVMPDKLSEIQAIYATHLRGEKIDIPAIEAKLGRPLASEQQDYQLREGGVAHLALNGVIAPKANLFTQISGGVTSDLTLKQIRSMHADPRVRSVLLELDSPGGSVFGVPAVADAIHALGQDKPTVSLSTGMMASAGYWWGSAANAVYISGLTDFIGSIGVVATHSYKPNTAGAESTEITAGRYKRMASGSAPLTEEGRAYLQAQVDELYRVFVDTVARQRGVSAEQVLQHMADGRIFVGQQSIDAGLVDGVSSVETLIEQLATDPSRYARRATARIAASPAARSASAQADAGAAADVLDLIHPQASAAVGVPAALATHAHEPVLPVASTTPTPPQEGSEMPITRESLERDEPQLFAALSSEFMSAGATAERDRITAVRGATLPGHEALIERLAMDGHTTGPEAAMAVLAAHRTALASAGAAHFADAPKAAAASAAPLDERNEGNPAAAADAGAAAKKPAGLSIQSIYARMNGSAA